MTPDIMTAMRAAGITISVDDGNLVARPKAALTDELRSLIRAHKAAILAELARTSLSPAALAELPAEDPTCPAWRISIVAPGGVSVEFDIRSTWTMPDWGRFATRHYGGAATVLGRVAPTEAVGVDAITGQPRSPAMPGVSASFAARLSPEDLADIAAGDIPVDLVQAFEQAAIAREAETVAPLLPLPEVEAITVAGIDVITGLPMTRPEDLTVVGYDDPAFAPFDAAYRAAEVRQGQAESSTWRRGTEQRGRGTCR